MGQGVSIIFRIVVALIYLGAAVNFSATSLNTISKDTIGLSNSVFVIFASLAALSFGYANAIRNSPTPREKVIYAGERFLHGSLWVLSASAIRYLQRWQGIEEGGSAGGVLKVIGQIVTFFPVITFIIGLIFAFMGYVTLDAVLFNRLGTKQMPRELRKFLKP